jgi:hypothetical protein
MNNETDVRQVMERTTTEDSAKIQEPERATGDGDAIDAEVLSLRSQLTTLTQERDAAREEVAFIQGGKSPCGHWGAYAVYPDGIGKRIDCLQCQRDALVQAARGVVVQFQAISHRQDQLLVEGQTFESAAENWDKATLGQYIDFGALMEALASVEGLKHG